MIISCTSVIFTKYCQDDKKKDDDMDGACQMHGGDEKCLQIGDSKSLSKGSNLEDLGIHKE
jgi:hypothetical protein